MRKIRIGVDSLTEGGAIHVLHVMVGEHDISAALAQYEFLVTTIPQAEGHRFADAAHLPNVERPEEFERVLIDWLDRHRL